MLRQFKNIKNHAARARDFLLDLIFPIECLDCGETGAWLCFKCFRNLKFKTDTICPCCDQMSGWGKYCDKCKNKFILNGVFIAGSYKDGKIEKLIKHLKYRFVYDVAEILANYLTLYFRNLMNQAQIKLISNLAQPFWQQFEKSKNAPLIFSDLENTIVIPIPLHKKRLSWRGFNQSELIAKIFSQNQNLKINTTDLKRIKHKKAQAKLSGKKRQENIKDCFAWLGDDLTGKNIILLDDIITTGSTLNEAAHILKQKNAQEIWGLVIAKG